MDIDYAVAAGFAEVPVSLELTVDGDGAAGRGDQPGEYLAEGGFAPTVLADERMDGAWLNRKIEVAQDRLGGYTVVDVAQLDKERGVYPHVRPRYCAWQSYCRVSGG